MNERDARMRRSPLMDAEQYRDDLAAACTEIWKRFVAGQPEDAWG